jgi:CHAT domain
MTSIEVAITPSGAPGSFRVEVVASAAGEASIAAVRLDANGLLARRGLLQQAVLASTVPSRRVLPETEVLLRKAGEELFAALLGTGEVAGRYRAASALAAAAGEALQVVLRIDTPELAGLPWEAMYDQAAGAYVCRQNQLVRHVPVASVPARLHVEPPLRILGVISSPRGLRPLDVERERDLLGRALAGLTGRGQAELCWAPSATWAELQDVLLDGGWHVLHFIGHGDFDGARDEGVLALEDEGGRTDMVPAHRLVDLLRLGRPMPRLAVLNSCSGATAGTGDLFSGTAAALVRGGVAAVAAMQFAISDSAAAAFAHGFYAAIARGRGVDDAVSSGRVAILGTADQTLEWLTPVLYLCGSGHDTRLFALPASAASRSRDDAHSQCGRISISGGAGGAPEHAEVNRARAARILDDAERAAQQITRLDLKARALARVAVAVTVFDPERAARLGADAERAAQSGSDVTLANSALADIAGVLAATDPDHAERIARSAASKGAREERLEPVATMLAATDPDRAERIAQSITENDRKARVLAHIAAAVARTDPGRAARLSSDAEDAARSLLDIFSARVLADIAAILVAGDPDRAARLGADAEHVAHSITDDLSRAWAQADMAATLADTDPDRAARLGADVEGAPRSVHSDMMEHFRAEVVASLAAADPDRAERVARSITSDLRKPRALADVAEVLAATDPDRAERVACSIADEGWRGWALARVASVLAATYPDRASRLSADAEHLAQLSTDEGVRGWALAKVVEVLAVADPDRAERVARSITSEGWKARTLVELAEAWG